MIRFLEFPPFWRTDIMPSVLSTYVQTFELIMTRNGERKQSVPYYFTHTTNHSRIFCYGPNKEIEGKEKLLSSIFLQMYNLLCSCSMHFAVVLFLADVLKLFIIPMYNLADVQMNSCCVNYFAVVHSVCQLWVVFTVVWYYFPLPSYPISTAKFHMKNCSRAVFPTCYPD